MVDLSVGDKVRIIDETHEYVGKTGEIFKDGGIINVGFRELNKGFDDNITNRIQQWLVKLDSNGEELLVIEGMLEKIK